MFVLHYVCEYVYRCACVEALQRSENNLWGLWECPYSFHHVVPGIKLGLSSFATSELSHLTQNFKKDSRGLERWLTG